MSVSFKKLKQSKAAIPIAEKFQIGNHSKTERWEAVTAYISQEHILNLNTWANDSRSGASIFSA